MAAVSRVSRALWEGLEPRQLMCLDHVPGAAALSLWASGAPRAEGSGAMASITAGGVSAAAVSASDVSIAANSPSGLPWLHSLPGAGVAIFLDFDGFSTNLPYDTDGNPANFAAAEQSVITEAWRHIASYFSMFNADVTTQPPSVPYSYSLISNSHPDSQPGYSYLQFPTTSPSAYNSSGDARGRQSGLAHEIGHNFSLAHQGDFNLLGEKVNEYSSGYDRLHGPVMGVDFAQDVHKWFLGHPSHSPSLLQDDVAVIADRINDYTGGDGFRPDDVPNVTASARVLTADATGKYAASGIIERMADADAYAFTSYGGQVTIDVVPPQPSMLDAKVEVYAGDGTLVATGDVGTNDQHLTIPALGVGTFYAVVKSHGNYGDLGPYDLTIRPLSAEWASRDLGGVGQKGNAVYNGADNSYSLAGGGADIGGTADELHFAYTQLIGDGSITARVLSVENTGTRAAAGVSIRESLGAGSRHATLALTPTAGAQFRYRVAAGGPTSQVTAAGIQAPYWVRLVRSGTTVTASRSEDGVTWTDQGSMTFPSGAAPVYVGLSSSAGNDGALSDARFDSVALEGAVGRVGPAYNTLPAPANLTLTRGALTGVDVSWDAVAGATGYAVERSVDGVTWTTAGSTAADVLTHGDLTLAGSQRYYYRVSATDADGRSAPTAVASVVNRPTGVMGLAVTSWQTDKLILNWRDTLGETGYRIERAPDGSDVWAVRGTAGVNAPSFTDTGLAADTRYRYRVVPTSPFGDGAPIETTGTTRLAAVTGVAFTEKLFNRMSLKWNPTAGATSYRVRRSTDGVTFATVATIAGTTYDDRAVTGTKEYYYRIVAINSRSESMDGASDSVFGATPAPAALPAGWLSRDIGAVGGTGATGFAGPLATGTFTVIGSGADIWGAADAFRFAYQPLVGDGSIVARVSAQEDTGGWAKAGVMIRESLTPGSRQAMMVVTPGNGTALQYRTATGGQSTNNNTAGPKAPYWVRLVRLGNAITASRSVDGVNWTSQGSINITMNRSVYVGLAVVSADNTALATVTFNNVTVSNTAPTVATPAAAAPLPVTGVSATLSVLGADDHGENNLTYTWFAAAVPDGAAAPSFNDNGTNTAKLATATFSQAGTYVLRVRATDAWGLSVESEVTVVVEPTLTTLAVTPAGPLRIEPGATVQFSAAALDQFGRPMPGGAPPVAWLATGGTVSVDGAYTAPAEVGSYAVTAFTGDFSGTADVTVALRDTTAPTLLSVSSRKTHGSRGAFDLHVSLTGDPGTETVEPRVGGPTLLRFVFSEAMAAADGTLDAGEFLLFNAEFGSAELDPTGTVLTLSLTGVHDRSVIGVTLGGLVDLAGNDQAGDGDVYVRALAGDVNGNGVVNDADFLLVRRAMLRTIGASDFLADLDVNGTVGTFDLLHVRRNDGATVLR